MYCILYDKNTGGFYMPPFDMSFYVYSDPSKCITKPENTRLVETEYETEAEVKAILWRYGFFRGYIDDQPVAIKNADVTIFARNNNDLIYCQYLLTGDKQYLEMIQKNEFYTVCKIDGENIYFPVICVDDINYILVYTNKNMISNELKEKYPSYKTVNIGFNSKFIINDKVYK